MVTAFPPGANRDLDAVAVTRGVAAEAAHATAAILWIILPALTLYE
ncbi:MAG: hypothetical protein AAF416_17665 [Pseudomonadota bacterium]